MIFCFREGGERGERKGEREKGRGRVREIKGEDKKGKKENGKGREGGSVVRAGDDIQDCPFSQTVRCHR